VPGALIRQTDQKAWSITATVHTGNCMAYHGVECRSCNDPCESRAIKMIPRIGGVSIPVIDAQLCTGCGACFTVCPVNSITMKHAQESQ